MKKTTMRKLLAVILAVMMLAAISVTAFAADNTYTGSGNANATGVADG